MSLQLMRMSETKGKNSIDLIVKTIEKMRNNDDFEIFYQVCMFLSSLELIYLSYAFTVNLQSVVV